MKVFEFVQDMDRFCPWEPDDGSLGRIRDRMPVGAAVGDDWQPSRGSVRAICGLEKGDFPYWLDPLLSGRAREGLGDLLDPWGEWLPVETTNDGEFFIYNVTTVIDCVDHERSRLARTPDGLVYGARRLYFHRDKVDSLCFRVPEGLTPSFYMLGDVVDQVAELQLRGLAPLEIWDSDIGSCYLGLM